MDPCEQMLHILAAHLGKRGPGVQPPAVLMNVVVRITRPMPAALRPPVTTEQLRMLEVDNAPEHSATPDLIGAAPTALVDSIGYLAEPPAYR